MTLQLFAERFHSRREPCSPWPRDARAPSHGAAGEASRHLLRERNAAAGDQDDGAQRPGETGFTVLTVRQLSRRAGLRRWTGSFKANPRRAGAFNPEGHFRQEHCHVV
jgi:hypothetical protein